MDQMGHKAPHRVWVGVAGSLVVAVVAGIVVTLAEHGWIVPLFARRGEESATRLSKDDPATAATEESAATTRTSLIEARLTNPAQPAEQPSVNATMRRNDERALHDAPVSVVSQTLTGASAASPTRDHTPREAPAAAKKLALGEGLSSCTVRTIASGGVVYKEEPTAAISIVVGGNCVLVKSIVAVEIPGVTFTDVMSKGNKLTANVVAHASARQGPTGFKLVLADGKEVFSPPNVFFLVVDGGVRPVKQYEPDSTSTHQPFAGVAVVPGDDFAVRGAHHFRPVLLVDNTTTEAVTLLSATLTAEDGSTHTSSPGSHAFWITAPSGRRTEISAIWNWKTPAAFIVGRRCRAVFHLQHGARQAEIAVEYRRANE